MEVLREHHDMKRPLDGDGRWYEDACDVYEGRLVDHSERIAPELGARVHALLRQHLQLAQSASLNCRRKGRQAPGLRPAQPAKISKMFMAFRKLKLYL